MGASCWSSALSTSVGLQPKRFLWVCRPGSGRRRAQREHYLLSTFQGRTPRSLRILNLILAFQGIRKLFVKVGKQNTSNVTLSNLKMLKHKEFAFLPQTLQMLGAR